MLTIKGRAKNGQLMPHELELTNNGVELEGVLHLKINPIRPDEPITAIVTMQVSELDLDIESLTTCVNSDELELHCNEKGVKVNYVFKEIQ